MQFINADSPFAIYEGGSGYVLPNDLPEMARAVSRRIDLEPVDVVVTSLRESGRRRLGPDASLQDAGKLWAFFLHHYLTPMGSDTPSTDIRVAMLKLMLIDPPGAAWLALRSAVLQDIDNISGWSTSFRKELAERDQVWRGEDGNYYRKDSDGTIYDIIGAKTLEEARLDFLTEQINREFGNLRVFLQLFSWFMIARDFVNHPNSYHKSMKAIIQGRQWPSLNHSWSLLQFRNVRTTVWRPDSNLCDPLWLASDLLASITDTLAVQPYLPLTVPDGSDKQLGPEYAKQADFALESQVRMGNDEAIVLTFQGRQFRWINASLESDTRVSVGIKATEDASVAQEELNRFLSVLVWEHGFPISIKSGPIVGQKRALPLILSPRSIFSLLVNPDYPLRTNVGALGSREKLLLAMFREAANSRSVFYAFLNYWKVIEVVFPAKDPRHEWVDQAASRLQLEQPRVQEILSTNSRIATYLDYECRSAIAHVFRKPFVNPDSGEDFVRLSKDLPVVKSLAKIAMKTIPDLA